MNDPRAWYVVRDFPAGPNVPTYQPEPYRIVHETWGSAPHACPLTQAGPYGVLGYACPVCNGAS